MSNSPAPFTLFASNFDFSLAGMNTLINQMNALFPNVTTAGDQTTSGNLAVAGTSALTGNTTITGTLTQTGNASLAGTLAVTGTSALTGALTVTGKINANGGLTQAPTLAGAAITLTSAKAGSTILLDQASGSVVTLPAATGTGNVYKIVCLTTATSVKHAVLAVGSDYLVGEVVGNYATAVLGFSAAVAATYQSLQMPYAGTQPSGGFQGDWFELTDIASAKWEVKGMFRAGTTATTPFSTATS